MKPAMPRHAFTLIELLIVVAIIAILAAIAIPNFLEAQKRSKVARAVADMRNVSIALESYVVDSNHYPVPSPHKPEAATNLTGTNVPNELSTPIAYITSVTSFFDPFSLRLRGMYNGQYNRYGYIFDEISNHQRYLQLTLANREKMGKWRLDSFGPDERSTNYPNEVSYDATNGTISAGDIYRSQKDASAKQF